MTTQELQKNKDGKGLWTLLRDLFNNASCNCSAHVSDGETTKLWKVNVTLYRDRVQRLHAYPSSVACLDETRLLFSYLSSTRVNLLYQLSEPASDLSSVVV